MRSFCPESRDAGPIHVPRFSTQVPTRVQALDPLPWRPATWQIAAGFFAAFGVGLTLGALLLGKGNTPRSTHRLSSAEARLSASTNTASRLVHLDALEHRVRRLEGLADRVALLTGLSDRRRWLATGPVSTTPSGVARRRPVLDAADDPPTAGGVGGAPGRALNRSLTHDLERRVSSGEARLRGLLQRTIAQQALLRTVPSRWPARGWVTSRFGVRRDPYTGRLSFHKGLDIANRRGTPIRAPADGLVVFAGRRQGFGKVMMLDHGNGFRTRFAHLHRFRTAAGKRVRRGDHIGDMGATGRATGPHLHYEVRLKGVPVNPGRFLLD